MTDRFLRRWLLWATLGEAVGFIVPATVGGVLALSVAPAIVVYPAMIAAGAVEGALLGFGQYVGFGPTRPVPRGQWIGATAAGAAVAWSIGMLPSTLGGIGFDTPLDVAMVAGGALLLLASIPTLQWVVLRGSVGPSGRWIPINLGAWAVAILWTIAPSPFIDERTPVVAILAVYVVAGLLMAATVALLTGFAARRVAMAGARVEARVR